jgi:hypothetical protein
MLLENHLSSASVTADEAQPSAQNSLNARHYKECIEKRGLNPQWILANCFSVTANEASQKLGYTAQSDGIRLEGCNHQSQFKPDRPWKLEGDKGDLLNTAPRRASMTQCCRRIQLFLTTGLIWKH